MWPFQHFERNAGDAAERFRTGMPSISLDDAIHEACVEVLDQRPDEAHLLARILENDARVVRLAAEAVWRHHHRQVAGVHLCYTCILRRSKDLREKKKRS